MKTFAPRLAPALDLAGVAFVSLVVRVAHAAFLSRTPFFEGPVIDSRTYWLFAEHLAATGDFGGAFYQPPLYPAFLALLFAVGWKSAWAVAIVQALLGSATAALMVLVGRRLASGPGDARRVGLVVGLTTALYGPLVFYDLEFLPPALVHLLLVGALVLSLGTRAVGVADAVLGLLVGLAVTGWPLGIAFLPLTLALRSRRLSPGRERGLGLALALLTASVPLAITARHNALHDGQGVVVSYNSGINLWLGNNPNWRATWRARPGAAFEPELERPDREGVTRPADRAAYFARRVELETLRRPGAALGRTLEKFYYVWHGREIRRDQDIELLREASPILRCLVGEAGVRFPFGIVGPLALLSLWRRRRETDVKLLALFAVGYALMLSIFFVSSRYRLPLALSLIPLAVDQAFHFFRVRAPRFRPLVAFGIGIFVLNLPNAFTAGFRADDAERGILAAEAWRNQGKVDRAERISEELVPRFPDDPNVRMLRAEILVSTNRCDAAIPELERTIALAPNATTPRVMLGTCFDELGSPERAERAFAAALSLHPHHALALERTGAMYARRGRLLEARALLTRFVDDGYDDPEVTALLRRIAAALDRRAERL